MKTLKQIVAPVIAVIAMTSAVPAFARTGENKDYEGKATHCMSAKSRNAKEKSELATSALNPAAVIRAAGGR